MVRDSTDIAATPMPPAAARTNATITPDPPTMPAAENGTHSASPSATAITNMSPTATSAQSTSTPMPTAKLSSLSLHAVVPPVTRELRFCVSAATHYGQHVRLAYRLIPVAAAAAVPPQNGSRAKLPVLTEEGAHDGDNDDDDNDDNDDNDDDDNDSGAGAGADDDDVGGVGRDEATPVEDVPPQWAPAPPQPQLPTRLVDTLELSYEHPGYWATTLRLETAGTLHYKYVRVDDGSSGDGGEANAVWETGSPRVVDIAELPPHASPLLLRDVWRAVPDATREVFATAAFQRVLFRAPALPPGPRLRAARVAAAHAAALAQAPYARLVRFAVFAQHVAPADTLAVVGDVDTLGANDATKAVPLLRDAEPATWAVYVALPSNVSHVRFRFVVLRDGVVVVEDNTPRELHLSELDAGFLSPVPGAVPVVFAPSEPAFAFPRKWRASGVALPVFSIRSRNGCGIGEFNDLKPVVDFCVKTGHQLLQLLPINDTLASGKPQDSYPYKAVSSFALHPQYLNIESLGTLPPALQAKFDAEKELLNSCEKIDCVNVWRVKDKFIKEMFKIHRNEFLLSTEFTNWFSEHQGWLVPYALFRFFIYVNGTENFDQWGTRSKMSPKDMVRFADPRAFHFDYLALVYYTQFHLHKQLQSAAEYAADNGVIFKGDLPIGVHRYCADTWVNPHLFRLDMQAGAPPDFFSTHGQNWGFPTYNWNVMSQDNYGWWRARLGHMARYFHAYRIDHILGFFRIWEIPRRYRTGMAGRFYPAHALSRQELESHGLWDIERYTKPFVNDRILQDLFQGDWWRVRERFFQPLYHDRLQFKGEFGSEWEVEKALSLPPEAPLAERKYNEDVNNKLCELFNNVLLLQDSDDGDLFHPRFMLQNTTSFVELPSQDWKGALYHLHEEYMHRRQNELWRRQALERLPMMKSASNMLVCGEDLGFLADCVPEVMEEMSILSLAVQRMPSGDAEFGLPSEYKYETVATTSSHDTSTFRGWWENITGDERWRYWTSVMGRNGQTNPPPEECTGEIVEWAICDHLHSPAMWTIFPMQDLLGMHENLRRKDAAAEQINDPANSEHVWTFRMHLDIEELVENEEFTQKLAKLNKRYGRGATYC